MSNATFLKPIGKKNNFRRYKGGGPRSVPNGRRTEDITGTRPSRSHGPEVGRLPDAEEVAGSIPAAITGGRMHPIKQVIVVRKDLNMRKGKLAAQVAHASMKFLIDNNTSERPDTLLVELGPDEAQWLFNGTFTKVVVGCDSEGELKDLVLKAELLDVNVCAIVDSGKTEFKGEPTLTCAAFGPAPADELDRVTGHLSLL